MKRRILRALRSIGIEHWFSLVGLVILTLALVVFK